MPRPTPWAPRVPPNLRRAAATTAPATCPVQPMTVDGQDSGAEDDGADAQESARPRRAGGGAGRRISNSDSLPSHDPSGTGEVMDAAARTGGGDESGETPGGRRRRGAGLGRGDAPSAQYREGRGQGAGPGRGNHPERPGQHARLAHAAAALHDRRGQGRLQLEPPQPALHRLGPLPALDPFGGDRDDRRHHRHFGLSATGDARRVLGGAARGRGPRSGPKASSFSRSTPPCRTRRSTPPTTSPTKSRSRGGAAPTSGPDSNGSTSRGSNRRSASTSPTWSAPDTPRPSRHFRDLLQLVGAAFRLEPRTLGGAHRHRRLTPGPGGASALSPCLRPPEEKRR